MTATTIELLPQSPNGILQSSSDRLRILTLNKALIEIAISALENFFIHRNFYEFDGHVGESLCQIRAYQMYLLGFNLNHNSDHLKGRKKIVELKQLANKFIQVIFYEKKNNSRKNGRQPLIDFLYTHELVCSLSDLEIYLIQLHLLSQFKFFDENMISRIDYQKICFTINTSKHTARRIIHIYQVNTSKYSTHFISSLIVKRKDNLIFTALLNNFKKVDEDGRHTLPCYAVIKILYESMWENRCPILIICKRFVNQQLVDTVCLLFKPSIFLKNKYEYCEFDSSNQENFCFVLEGIATYQDINFLPAKKQYIHLFLKHGIKDILFANMAIHPQYAGIKLLPYKDIPYLKTMTETNHPFEHRMFLQQLHQSQQKMKNYALSAGCGKSNPSLFYISHIFCDKVKNQIKQNEGNKHLTTDNSTLMCISNYKEIGYFPLIQHPPVLPSSHSSR